MKRLLAVTILVLCGWPAGATRIQGTIRYEDFTIGLSGFTSSIFRPVRLAEVQVVDVDQGNKVLLTATTGEDGRFDVEVASAGMGTRIAINLTARNPAAEVTDNLRQPYRWTTSSSPLAINADPFVLGTLDLGETDNAGALNILDVITAGRDYVTARTSKPISRVRVIWKKNVATCTCYSDQEISLVHTGSSVGSDTDEYDDSVILHEYGHHVQDQVTCSRSPGGSHELCSPNQHPALAWSEGSAQYFSVVVAGLDTHIDHIPGSYLDTLGNFASGSQIAIRDDLENNDVCVPLAYGVGNEASASRVLWDLQDDAVDGPDHYQRSEREIFGLLEQMQGDPTCDFRSFIGELCGQLPADAPAYAGIFAAFNIAVQPPCPRAGRQRIVRR